MLGELATRYLLRVGGDADAASAAAAGWNGDRYELWRRGDAAARDCAHPCRDELVLVDALALGLRGRRARSSTAPRPSTSSAGLGGEPRAHATWRVEDGAVALASRRDDVGARLRPGPETARAAAAAQL